MTTTARTITAQELADVRWLARECLADALDSTLAGCSSTDDPHDLRRTQRVIACAWAVGATGQEFNDHEEEEPHWPMHLGPHYIETLIREAGTLEELYLVGLDPDLPPERVDRLRGGLERIRRIRAFLAEALEDAS